ncbi:MAG: hypothetical protein WD397_15970 [Wenzhouxiangellaceae bacterium]
MLPGFPEIGLVGCNQFRIGHANGNGVIKRVEQVIVESGGQLAGTKIDRGGVVDEKFQFQQIREIVLRLSGLVA